MKRGSQRPSRTSAPPPKVVAEGRRRVVFEAVTPEVDGGRFPAKRSVGELVTVEADIFADGHDALSAVLRHRHESSSEWIESPMLPRPNDRWRGEFPVTALGRYRFTLVAWVDHFETWSRALAKRVQAGQDVTAELEAGARMVESAAERAGGNAADAARLRALAATLRKASPTTSTATATSPAAASPVDAELSALMARYGDRASAVTYERELEVLADPVKARFSTWYELFPRSAGVAGRHGTLKDVERMLPDIARMGFDVLYLPPIHPIGTRHRKGANNRPAAAGEPGSPWAIGSAEGGHKAIHPDLGTLDDFKSLVAAAAKLGIDVALDIAFQTAPDHPYTSEHPEWFRHRPDGSIQYAENPPKKYEDIYPFDFETEAWRELWAELLSVVDHWIAQGVRVFRVDNPHTKPFAFWEWLIGDVKRRHPDVIFLSEAFTRPKVMYRLAKLGFTQSYTYFSWRNAAWELYQYFTELSQPELREFFRPNLWPNTPDILTDYLQHGGRAAFQVRLLLAATLGASYGIYGPTFELMENRAREQGSEEYLDSEKYQLRAWNREDPQSLRELITIINQIRRENPALQSDRGLRFHLTENDQLLAYSKSTPGRDNVILVVANCDPYHVQRGMVTLPLEELGIEADRSYQAHELLSGARYQWNGPRNYIEINPFSMPAQIFRFRHRVRSEHDFEYFL